MKKVSTFLAVALLSLSLCAPAQAKNTEWTATSFAFLTHPVTVGSTLPWIAMLEKASQGKLKINLNGPNTVCPDGEVFASVEAGIVDLGYQLGGRNPGRFPFLELAELPLVFSDAPSCGLTMRDIIAKYPVIQKDFASFELWNIGGATLMQIGTTKKPINTLEDLKGMKIGCTSAQAAEIMNTLGATGVVTPFADVYMALERGIVDGLLMPAVAFKATKTSDLLRYLTLTDLYSGAVISVVNKEAWSGLDAATREALKPVIELLPMNTNKLQIALDDAMIAECATKKTEVIRLSQEEKARWRVKVQALHQAWVSKMEGKGVKEAQAILDDMISIAATYAQDSKGMKIMDETVQKTASYR